MKLWRTYGAAVIGNCCGRGSEIVSVFRRHPRVQLLAGYERPGRRAEELAYWLGMPLAGDAEEILLNPSVRIVVLACEPAEKASWFERAAHAGKHIYLTSPMCDSLSSSRRILTAAEVNPIKCVQDLPMVRFHPAFGRVLDRARRGHLGKVFSYYHVLSMNFASDFDVAAKWPELLSGPERMGGGELAQIGCDALGFAVTLLGRPQRVQANWQHEWPAYQKAEVEHFGQIVMDYGSFFAVIAVGRLRLEGRFSHSNFLQIVSERMTLTIDSSAGVVIRNNIPQTWGQFMGNYEVESALDQLVRCLEEDTDPDSSVQLGADGIEVVMAAYRSILANMPVELPLGEGANPLQKQSEE